MLYPFSPKKLTPGMFACYGDSIQRYVDYSGLDVKWGIHGFDMGEWCFSFVRNQFFADALLFTPHAT